MDQDQRLTFFLPVERASETQLVQQVKLFSEQTLVRTFLNSVQDIIVVLNQERQIVFANPAILEWLGDVQVNQICGVRFGEAVNCVHAQDMQSGCGTSKYCEFCGAARAILNSRSGRSDVQDCRIMRANGDAIELRVKASPITIEGQEFTILTAVDISHENRRRALERVFFHDILNTAGGLKGFSQLLMDADAQDLDQIKTTIQNLSEVLIDEIYAQREILAAEHGELKAKFDLVKSEDVFIRVVQVYQWHPVGLGLEVKIGPETEKFYLKTDLALLVRVISNLTKNALEASHSGETVTLGAHQDGEKAVFWVHNNGVMAKDVQMQIFNRSFSTKGSGRGLGTYSIKLLTEKYLNGEVAFSTDPEGGTIFRVILPLKDGDISQL